jgi:alkylhydroperoxidase family enzyme
MKNPKLVHQRTESLATKIYAEARRLEVIRVVDAHGCLFGQSDDMAALFLSQRSGR